MSLEYLLSSALTLLAVVNERRLLREVEEPATAAERIEHVLSEASDMVTKMRGNGGKVSAVRGTKLWARSGLVVVNSLGRRYSVVRGGRQYII